MVIPAENKNLPTNDQRGEKFIKLCYNLVPHAFLGDAKSYVGKDRYRIKVKKYLSFLYPYAFRLVPLILLLYPSNRPVLIGHLAWFARLSIRFSFNLANRVPMDARYLLHSGNRKSQASSDGIYTEARLVILVPGHLYGLSSVTVS